MQEDNQYTIAMNVVKGVRMVLGVYQITAKDRMEAWDEALKNLQAENPGSEYFLHVFLEDVK